MARLIREEEQLGMFDLLGVDKFTNLTADEPIKVKNIPVSTGIDYTEGVEGELLIREDIPYESVFTHKIEKRTLHLTRIMNNSPEVMRNLKMVRSILTELIGSEQISKLKLKYKDGVNFTHIVPTSGGADSSCLAMVMRALFPSVNFYYVFNDTEAESDDLYESLNRLERFLGIKINRVRPERGLYELIEHKNGYMPSQRNRYCTNELKIQPMLEVMEYNFQTSAENAICNYVGIRFDEDRAGMVSDDEQIYTEMPYMTLKMSKDHVYEVLLRTVGLPEFYNYKTRSGCIGCFFMRRSEKSAQLFFKPKEFQFVSSKEKLALNDIAKYGLYWKDNYRDALYDNEINIPYTDKGRVLYYIPEFVDTRTKGSDELRLSSSPNKMRERIFVGVAMYTPSLNMGCNNHLVYNTEFAVYSNRKHNLVDQMITWYDHQILNWHNKKFDSRSQMESHINLVCFEVELPTDIGKALKSKTESDSFTNSFGECYMQIESITRLMHTILTYERTKQDWNEYKRYLPEGEYDLFDLGRMANEAHYIKRDLQKQTVLMDMLGNPSLIAHEIKTPTARELAARKRKSSKKQNSGNKEAIALCTACDL